MDMYSLFAQDSWRVTPTLTLNAGLRWDVQMPFTPVNDIMSAVTLGGVCGISGLGDGGIFNACNFFEPGASGGRCREFVAVHDRARSGYKTDWNNVAPNVGVAWRPNVQSGCLRTLLGDPEQATLRGGYSVAYERQGLGVFTGVYGANPGSTLSLTRNASTGLVRPGESWPVLLSQTDRLYNAPFPRDADLSRLPIAGQSRRQHRRVRIPTSRSPRRAPGRSSFQRALTQRHGGRRPLRRHARRRTSGPSSTTTSATSIENGFLDEFKLAMANLQANNAAGGSRAGSFAYFGAGTGTNPLPIYLAYLNGRARRRQPGGLHRRHELDEHDARRGDAASATNPQPGQAPPADLDGNADAPRQRAGRRLCRRTSSWSTRTSTTSTSPTAARSATTTRCRSSCGAGCRTGFRPTPATSTRSKRGSAFLGFHFGRVDESDQRQRAPRDQDAVGLDAAGRPRPAVRQPTAPDPERRSLGGWQFNGVGRIQARTSNFGNVRLVGMTHRRRCRTMYKFDIRIDPATGLRDRLHAAGRRDPEHAAGVQHQPDVGDRLHATSACPTGRYFAPANSADCIQLKAGDCAPRDAAHPRAVLHALRHRRDQALPDRGRTNFELRLDVLNVFDNINFTDRRVAPGRHRRDDLPDQRGLLRIRTTRTIRAAGSGS